MKIQLYTYLVEPKELLSVCTDSAIEFFNIFSKELYSENRKRLVNRVVYNEELDTSMVISDYKMNDKFIFGSIMIIKNNLVKDISTLNMEKEDKIITKDLEIDKRKQISDIYNFYVKKNKVIITNGKRYNQSFFHYINHFIQNEFLEYSVSPLIQKISKSNKNYNLSKIKNIKLSERYIKKNINTNNKKDGNIIKVLDNVNESLVKEIFPNSSISIEEIKKTFDIEIVLKIKKNLNEIQKSFRVLNPENLIIENNNGSQITGDTLTEKRIVEISEYVENGMPNEEELLNEMINYMEYIENENY